MIRKLDIKGLGPINNASVDFANLTLICGKNGVGKTYLSYTHYLLMVRFYQAFKSALSFPTLKAWCDGLDIGKVDVMQLSFELDIADVQLDLDKVKSEIHSADSILQLSNELKLHENSTDLPVIEAQIDSDYFAGFIDFEVDITYRYSLVERTVATTSGSTKINMTMVVNADDGQSLDMIHSHIDSMMKHFICTGYLKQNHQAITSERTGISLFYKDLDDSLRQSVFNDADTISKISDKKYIKPIEDNISTVRQLAREPFHLLQKSATSDRVNQVHLILQDLIGGKYLGNDQEIVFQPLGKDAVKLSLKTSSGASKSLLLFDHFVNQLMHTHTMLIVDEPEMNLHLDGQKKIAQLLAALTNVGVKVVVTTHSDHFIREINNLITLSSNKINDEKRTQLLQQANIQPVALLTPQAVSAVVIEATTGNSKQMPVTELGIELELFNQEILASMDISNEIAYAMEEGGQS